MTLDIIVPHYREPWETCKYLLDSIALQRGIPFDNVRVIIVNDGETLICGDYTAALSEFMHYPFKIDYLVKEHSGVSATRNYGLDNSTADYVMFCDSDDGFLNNYGLHMVFSAMQERFDFLYSNFVEETFTSAGDATIIRHDSDLTFMHGKVYRRQFLIDNNLWFDANMTLHEDGYFNMLVFVTAQHEGKIKTIDTPFYLWRWNDESTVRSSKKDFVLRTYRDVMLTRDGICEQLKQRGYKDDYEIAVCMTVLNSYYDFQKPSYHTADNKKHLENAEREFKRFYKKYERVFNNCTNMKIAEIAQTARANACKNGLLIERQDLRSFLNYIKYEVK